MKRICMIECLVVMMALLAMPANAVTNEVSEVDTWFTWKKENGEWNDWVGCTQENKSILYNLQLKVGQPVKCKIMIKNAYNCSIDFWLTEPGSTNAYNVTQGRQINEVVGFHKVYAGNITSYSWELHPNGRWTGGNAPINIYWQISYATNVGQSDDSGSWAFTNPTIVDEEWQGGDGDDDGSDTGDNGNTSGGNNGGGIPGFEAMTAIAALGAAMAVAIFSRKKTKK